MYKTKPLFIVFEGVEGCGKSFQSKKLYRNLKKQKLKTILTREPGGTPSAEIIRNLILKDYFSKHQKEKFLKYTDTLLYLAARNEHVNNKIIPHLKRKFIVICDRFIDSTRAYQVHGKKVSSSFINNIHKTILKNLKPDITFILKVKPETALNRLKIVTEKYERTIFVEEALHRIVEVYYRLGLIEEARQAASILGYNYQGGEWYKRSYKVFNKKYKTKKNKKKEMGLIRRKIKGLFE